MYFCCIPDYLQSIFISICEASRCGFRLLLFHFSASELVEDILWPQTPKKCTELLLKRTSMTFRWFYWNYVFFNNLRICFHNLRRCFLNLRIIVVSIIFVSVFSEYGSISFDIFCRYDDNSCFNNLGMCWFVLAPHASFPAHNMRPY